ncbi:MAG: hypothetical protein DSZ28_01055 [Thiothrix sp.]|nr:MAG: hypothetical protein DSZ28_01055 [Thiothrix sp.]
MGVKRPWWFIVAIILISLPLYPLYIGTSAFLDYLLGDGLFLQDVLYGSPREVLRIVLANWKVAIPFSMGLFLLSLLPAWFLLRCFPWRYYFTMFAVGALLGFYFFKGGLLSTAAVAIAFFLVAIVTERTLRLTLIPR